ncbi:MAG TPA: hypothetical protein VNZ01_06970 [Solirubrobacteraceae bacterium]|jgi:hypothetical protein|nr:hypothetical protein [Solirubrobacteraceae bacterium]
MTLTLAIALNAFLMVALAAALTVLMSRAARLKPHLSAAVAPAFEPATADRNAKAHRGWRPNGAPAVVRS